MLLHTIVLKVALGITMCTLTSLCAGIDILLLEARNPYFHLDPFTVPSTSKTELSELFPLHT